jgi:hypothetical protein
MDILDEFPKEEQFMKDDQVKEYLQIIKSLNSGVISLNDYYRRLADFWEQQGFPEWAEELFIILCVIASAS